MATKITKQAVDATKTATVGRTIRWRALVTEREPRSAAVCQAGRSRWWAATRMDDIEQATGQEKNSAMKTNTMVMISAAILLVASGCASINFDYPRAESYSPIDTGNSYLGQLVADQAGKQPDDHAGFLPMSDGTDALAARLLLMSRAEQSINAQYYLIRDDVVGRAFIKALLDAADRGVLVRLLVDDMYMGGLDEGLAALDSHPNLEIRVFNPFHRGAAGRVTSAAFDFSRINRRMHNKSLTIDNQITLIGGRNMADEYFAANAVANFADFDVMAVGPIVPEVSTMFDTYWNHETALPVPAFTKELDDPEAALDALRDRLKKSREEVQASRYVKAIRANIHEFVDEGLSRFTWAPYEFVYDSPDLGVKSKSEEAARITIPLVEALRHAETEVAVVSPYFVLLKSGIEGFSQLQARGVDVTIITNSLASTDQVMVHGGYSSSRIPLLRSGVTIYEMRPDADVRGTEYGDSGGTKSMLHLKSFIVDQKALFIGSFNFDPRSANINTEAGVIIYDAALAALYASLLKKALPDHTYQVFLNEQGDLRWRGFDDGQEVVYDKEPETSWGRRFSAGFFRIVPKSQL
jgi:putative cardiolipin synthase